MSIETQTEASEIRPSCTLSVQDPMRAVIDCLLYTTVIMEIYDVSDNTQSVPMETYLESSSTLKLIMERAGRLYDSLFKTPSGLSWPSIDSFQRNSAPLPMVIRLSIWAFLQLGAKNNNGVFVLR